MALTDTLNSTGIAAFGLSMPILASSWCTATVTEDVNALSITPSSGSWKAPLPGLLRAVDSGKDVGVTLVRADGTLVAGPGVLLTVLPQAYLRLCRLYAQDLETSNANRPERARGLPYRPVPRYCFYAGPVTSGDKDGEIKAGDDTGRSGALTVHDANGMPIDPVAVAAALAAIMKAHTVLEATSDANPLGTILGAVSPSVVRLWLADHAGKPFDNAGTLVRGITAVAAPQGLYTLDASGGAGSALSGTVTLDTSALAAADRPLLVVGPATTGRLGTSFSPPQLPGSVTLVRDFFSLRVLRLKDHLLGTPVSAFDATTYEPPPRVRVNEPLNLHADGNDVLASAAAALASSPTEGLAVGQVIEGTFDAPSATGAAAHWPGFPVSGGSPSTDPLTLDLKTRFNPTADFYTGGAGPHVDVVLTLHGLPADAWVRVYSRKFIEDAREARGDGAGGLVLGSGDLTLLLKDPMALVAADGTATIPAQPTLRFDAVVIERNQKSRMYGNVAVTVGTTAILPALSGSNPFGTASRRGECHAGILGLGTHAGSLPSDPLQAALALLGEANPRDASRLPTMARRDLLVAGLQAGHWKATIAGGRLAGETLSSDTRLGAPGGPGGRETQVVGVSTQNGPLAYDVARMAFRRTTNIVTRLTTMASGNWDEPPSLSAPALGTPATASSGTFAGAVLQTISPVCETPELSALKSSLPSLPADWPGLVDWAKNNLVPDGGLPLRQQLLDALDGLKTNAKGILLADELRREVVSSCYGRRDALWALAGAIGRARHLIYIESPGFCSTKKDYGGGTVPAYAADLVQELTNRLRAATGLRVIICTPKFPDYARGYEPFAARETDDRRKLISGLPTASDPDGTRVAAFHPVGFPGRASRLESTVVIVDDAWALVGSSTFRRRGLTFDGGSDLVFTDLDLVEGRCGSIAEFRRQLMASRLGIPRPTDPGAIPNADWVRLREAGESFYVARDAINAGGLGMIELLWNGRTPNVTYPAPNSVPFELCNPEGQEFADGSTGWLAGALALAVLTAQANSF